MRKLIELASQRWLAAVLVAMAAVTLLVILFGPEAAREMLGTVWRDLVAGE